MKTEHIVLLAVGAYFVWRYMEGQKAISAGGASGNSGGGSGGGGGGGGGYSPPRTTNPQLEPQTRIVYVQKAIRTNPVKHHLSNQIVMQQSAALNPNTGNVTGFMNGVCDNSNKLTAWETNRNYNAVTLEY